MKNKIYFILFFLILIFNSQQAFSINVDLKNEHIQKLNLSWWEKFNDNYLTEYVIKTANDNYDIKINELTTFMNKEYVKESFGRELPQISIFPMFSRDKFSMGSSGSVGSMSGDSYLTNINLPLNVSYEADIWLKNRTATKIAKKEYEAQKFDEYAQFISLTSLTATTYIEIAGLDRQIELQEDLVKTREEIAQLTNINFKYGLSNSYEVTNVEQLYIEAQTELEKLKQARNIALNMLSVLLGESSENSFSISRNSIINITPPKDLPLKIDTEIINNRPDILKSEAELEAAALDVKLARKELLPSISLSGFLGFNSSTYSKIFDWKTFIMNGTAGFLQPLFTGGQLRARLRAKKYNYDRMLAYYQKTILTSIQEINDSLVSVKYTDKQFKNTARITNLEKTKYNDNIMYKYEKGLLSYLDTLEYKEKLLMLQKEETQSKIDYLISTIGLYKSVGGKL